MERKALLVLEQFAERKWPSKKDNTPDANTTISTFLAKVMMEDSTIVTLIVNEDQPQVSLRLPVCNDTVV